MIFEKEIREAAEKDKEKTIENMLRDNVKAANIMKWTGTTMDKIAAIATRMGMNTLIL